MGLGSGGAAGFPALYSSTEWLCPRPVDMPRERDRMNLPPQVVGRISFGNDCWEWSGYRDRDGYGRVYFDGKQRNAHRVVYELTRGEIPAASEIDHLCRNRSCVRPDHLRTVSHRENVFAPGSLALAKIQSERKTCPRGHVYDGSYRNMRRCSQCRRDEKRRYRLRDTA